MFFRDLQNVCVPKNVSGSTKAVKYHLTRRILIQHLSRSKLDFEVLELDSFESEECKDYISSHAVHFFLCDDGTASSPEQAASLQHLMWKIVASGRHTAIINTTTWRSSKVSISYRCYNKCANTNRCSCHY
jgi:hypothetical protein